LGAEADALCGAGYGERSSERTNQRNGYRHRQFDTRAGSIWRSRSYGTVRTSRSGCWNDANG
jgi:transposase-like protein